MLVIHGNAITSADDLTLNRAFGVCYMRNSKIDNLICWYIQQPTIFRFSCIQAFISCIVSPAPGRCLLIQQTHPLYPGPYSITMQGSRRADFLLVNRRIRVAQTPAGYTWHHKEGVRFSGNTATCQMYLLDSAYHRTPHHGGVQEYEQVFNCTYG